MLKVHTLSRCEKSHMVKVRTPIVTLNPICVCHDCLRRMVESTGRLSPKSQTHTHRHTDTHIQTHIFYIISEETSIFAPQRLRFYKALGDAACTVGKVRASTVFMCVCSMFRPSDFFYYSSKTDSWWGCVAKETASHLLMARPRHCLSAIHGWALPKQ